MFCHFFFQKQFVKIAEFANLPIFSCVFLIFPNADNHPRDKHQEFGKSNFWKCKADVFLQMNNDMCSCINKWCEWYDRNKTVKNTYNFVLYYLSMIVDFIISFLFLGKLVLCLTFIIFFFDLLLKVKLNICLR